MSQPDAQDETPTTQINPPVFFGAAGFIVFFVLLAVAFPQAADSAFTAVQDWIVNTFGWFYMLAVAGFLVFVIGLAISPYGGIKLGPDHAEPDYGYVTWFSMLFSAGMGIGLLFFGVAEPIMHFTDPPTGEGGTVEAARQAMSLTFFHWGVHAWAIYAVVGMALAYFAFRHNLPLTIRSALYPLIGDRIHGPIGHTVDIFAVLGTMFGVATSLGLGVLQINSGLGELLGLPQAAWVQLALIGGITAMATISVVVGLDGGIRRLSQLNLILAVGLLVFMLVMGPTSDLLRALVQNTGQYLGDIVPRSFQLYAYEPNPWIGDWTLFYWGWWMAWSPFVGMFIARVSRGRTIREFVSGVLGVPAVFTFMWMTFFGNTAISLDMGAAAGAISAAVSDSVPTAVFVLFEQLPLTTLASGLATLLVMTFFVTSSDSGSLVIDIITSGGSPEPPTWQRVFWAITEGVVAAVLLLAGGLGALQTASIASALPFAFVLILICVGLLSGLRTDGIKRATWQTPNRVTAFAGGGGALSWKQRLANLMAFPRREAVTAFMEATVRPALEQVAAELEGSRDLPARLAESDRHLALHVDLGAEAEFVYAVWVTSHRKPGFAMAELRDRADAHYYIPEVHLAEGSQHYGILGYSAEQVIADVLSHYDRHMQFLHITR